MGTRQTRAVLAVAVAIDAVLLLGSLVAFRQSAIDALRERWPWAFDVCGFWTTSVLLAPLALALFAVFLAFLDRGRRAGNVPTAVARGVALGTALVWAAAIIANAYVHSCAVG